MFDGSLGLIDLTLPSIEQNLALDEWLLTAVNDGTVSPCLRLWEVDRFAVVMGSASRVDDEVDLPRCRQDGVPILRRCSGGGVVVLGSGCLAYTIVLPILEGDRNITAFTQSLMGRVARAFQARVPGIEVCGTSDLAVNGKKVSGNAQRWRKRAALHHGTLLYDFPLDAVGRYLQMPLKEPEYRARRNHDDFVINLELSGSELRAGLIDAWNATSMDFEVPSNAIDELVASKYSTDAWNLRR